MAVREILLLGNPKLYQVCEPVSRDQMEELMPVVTDLRDTLLDPLALGGSSTWRLTSPRC